MITITLPDGSKKQFKKNITGFEIASSISKSLAKEAIIIEVNNEQWDLSREIIEDSTVRILTKKDPEILDLIRHDAAHILAQAVKELYPNCQITIGPSIENGFYYDISNDTPFSTDDLQKIEEKMKEISEKDEKFIRHVWNRENAIEYFKSIGEFYKAEIIESIPENENITIYEQGSFKDLCRGPHSPSTGFIKHFKLMKVAGAYWRGDNKNEMLQRIYGTAWATEQQLKDYLFMLEEAEKRDHRKLGKELNLFHIQEEAQGMVFWHDKGWSIYTTIEKYIRNKLKKQGYKEVKTPQLVDASLWKKSGHLEKFAENMFSLNYDDKHICVKPMSCPCHIQIFNTGIKSYRDLPLRMSEFGSCHRNEPTGSLHGLMRVRSFVQDDGHIFCTEEQITEETVKFCELLTEIYKDFGFENIIVKFSDRPPVRAGSDEVWDKAEKSLMDAAKTAGYELILNPGEGAFYGPKLEFVLKDAIGRDWQCGTIQVDLVLPDRLDATYISNSGEKKTPVMLHRAVIGTFERFIGILIEEYAGKFPTWLSPIQVAIATVTTDVENYANKLNELFLKEDIRSIIDNSNEKINYKIRNLSLQKIPYIAVVGRNESENNSISLRKFGSNESVSITIEDFISNIKKEISKYFE